MNIPSILGIGLISLIVIVKLYNGFKTISQKGIKKFLTQKLIILVIVAIIFGLFILIYSDLQFQSPHQIVINYIAEIL